VLKVVIGSVLSAFLCFSSLCHAAPPIKIGVLSGLSGPAAKRSRFQNMGITLAMEELKASGVDLSVVYEDSATNASKALTAFQKLYNHDRVAAVIANDFSFAIAPLIPVAKKQKRFLLTTNRPQASECHGQPQYFYSLAADHQSSGTALTSFLVTHPEIKKIAIFAFDDPAWGRVYKDVWSSIARDKGIEIVYTFESDNFLPDFRSPLTQALRRKPDALLFAHEPVSFLRTAKQLGFKGAIIAANNVFEALADEASPKEDLQGVFIVDPVIDEEFRRKFYERFKKQPILEAYSGYDSLYATVKALVAGGGDADKGISGLNFTGSGGAITFSNRSCSLSNVKWEILKYSGKRSV
jgi:ABC-type branched-subunit amino acid transport system substrate-binding protein